MPMLPTCLLQDVLVAVKSFFPPVILFPAMLLCDGISSNGTIDPYNQTCLRSCKRLNFTGWADPLAFTLCDMNATWCLGLANRSTGIGFIDSAVGGGLSELKASLVFMGRLIQTSQNNDTVSGGNATKALDAYRLCSLVSWVNTVPFVALVALGVMASAAVLHEGLRVIPALFALLSQMQSFHHAGAD